MSGKTNIALTIPRPRTAELVERPYPKIVPGYALIEVAIAPICIESRIWTDHVFEWIDDPEHLGHEGVGTVVEVAEGSHYQVGDRVIVFQGQHCGRCYACKHALSPTYCSVTQTAAGGPFQRGVQQANGSESGGFAMERYRIAPEANLYPIPDDLDFRYAATANCSLGCAFTGLRAIGVEAGDFVLVTGIGFIGLGYIINALYRNATPIALVRNEYRAELCRRLGTPHLINPEDENWLDQVLEITDGAGVDKAAECSGVPFYQRKCIEASRVYGAITWAGFQADPTYAVGEHKPERTTLELDVLLDVMDRQLTLTGGHDVRMSDRDGLVRMLRNAEVQRQIDVLVTHEFPMSEAAAALEISASKQCGKVYLYPQQ